MTLFNWAMSLLGRKPAIAELPAPAATTPIPSPAPSTPHVRTSKHRPELYTSFPWEPPAAPDALGQDETIRLAIATHTQSTEPARLAAWTDLELAQRRAERAATAKTTTRPSSRRNNRPHQHIPEPAPAPAFLPMLPRAPTSSPLARLPISQPTPHPRPVPPPSFRALFPLGPALLDAEHPEVKGLRSAVLAVLASIAAQHPHLLTDVSLPLSTTVVAFHVAPRQPAALRGRYFSATSVADAVVRALRAHGWGERAFGVGILRSGRIGKGGRMEWVREVGWAAGCEGDAPVGWAAGCEGDEETGTVAWIYREEGGDQGPLFGPETQWKGLRTWSFGGGEKEVVKVDSEWEEEEEDTVLQALHQRWLDGTVRLREGTVGFGGFGSDMKEAGITSPAGVLPPTGVPSPTGVFSPAGVHSPVVISSHVGVSSPFGAFSRSMAL